MAWKRHFAQVRLAHTPGVCPISFLSCIPQLTLSVCGSTAAVAPDLEHILSILEDLLRQVVKRLLTPEQIHHVTCTAFPRILFMLLKLRWSHADILRIHEFCKSMLRTTVELLRNSDTWELIECATRVLTDAAACTLYPRSGGNALSPKGLDDKLVSNSLGDCSGSEISVDAEGGDTSDDQGGIVSANLDFASNSMQHIEFFHQLGGFHACVERIAREPRLTFYGLKCLLRPFIKVRIARCCQGLCC